MAHGRETGDLRALAGCLLGPGGMALALLLIGWQCYAWLKTGHWPHLTMATVAVPLVSGSDFSAWLVAPRSWFGLHTVVRFMLGLPLWLWIIYCASGATFLFLKA
jgi:hypothetical protein